MNENEFESVSNVWCTCISLVIFNYCLRWRLIRYIQVHQIDIVFSKNILKKVYERKEKEINCLECIIMYRAQGAYIIRRITIIVWCVFHHTKNRCIRFLNRVCCTLRHIVCRHSNVFTLMCVSYTFEWKFSHSVIFF